MLEGVFGKSGVSTLASDSASGLTGSGSINNLADIAGKGQRIYADVGSGAGISNLGQFAAPTASTATEDLAANSISGLPSAATTTEGAVTPGIDLSSANLAPSGHLTQVQVSKTDADLDASMQKHPSIPLDSLIAFSDLQMLLSIQHAHITRPHATDVPRPQFPTVPMLVALGFGMTATFMFSTPGWVFFQTGICWRK